MFGNEFRCAKTKVFNPSGLNMAKAYLLELSSVLSFKVSLLSFFSVCLVARMTLITGLIMERFVCLSPTMTR